MLLLFFISHLFTLTSLHPIHVSVSEVELSEHEVTWTVRIYKDDLLLGMYGKNADVSNLGEPDEIKKDILAYLNKHLSFSILDKSLSWTVTDIQPDPESIWVILSAKTSSVLPSTFVIKNNILLDVYRDQKNIVNLIWKTGKKSVVFKRGSAEKSISL